MKVTLGGLRGRCAEADVAGEDRGSAVLSGP
jgi:hypothetical protein